MAPAAAPAPAAKKKKSSSDDGKYCLGFPISFKLKAELQGAFLMLCCCLGIGAAIAAYLHFSGKVNLNPFKGLTYVDKEKTKEELAKLSEQAEAGEAGADATPAAGGDGDAGASATGATAAIDAANDADAEAGEKGAFD